MIVIFYDIDNLTSRELRFYNTETKTEEVVNAATRGNTDYNFYGKFVHAWQANPISFTIFRYTPSGNNFQDYNYKTLLKVENSPNIGLKRIHYYDHQTKTSTWFEEEYVEPIQPTVGINSPANNNFTLSTSELLQSYCVDTTKKEDFHNGIGGITSTLIENSSECGFIPVTEGTELTEKILISVNHDCIQNPVYLGWLNQLGAMDYYMFSYRQLIRSKTKTKGTYKKNTTDISEVTNNEHSLGFETDDTMILGIDNLSKDLYFSILPVIRSKYVKIIQPLGSEEKDIHVNILDSNYEFDTKENIGTIEIEIKLPERF